MEWGCSEPGMAVNDMFRVRTTTERHTEVITDCRPLAQVQAGKRIRFQSIAVRRVDCGVSRLHLQQIVLEPLVQVALFLKLRFSTRQFRLRCHQRGFEFPVKYLRMCQRVRH